MAEENKYSWKDVVIKIGNKEISCLTPLKIEADEVHDECQIIKGYTMQFKLTEEEELVEIKKSLASADLLEVRKVPTKEEILVEALEDAVIQLEYLNSRWPTGTTPAVLVRIKAAIEAVERQ